MVVRSGSDSVAGEIMMMQCGGCSAQQVSEVAQMLMNPGTWVLVVSALTTAAMLASGQKKGGDKK
jgi:hypothetical protein